MPRSEKVAAVEQLRQQLDDASAVLLTDYRGLSVADLTELRAALREADTSYTVVKNTLTRIAADEAGYEALGDALVGPTALALCAEDPVRPARALRAFAAEHPELAIKGGIVDGRVVDADTAQGLADLATREELLRQTVVLAQTTMSRAARLFNAPLSKMARVMGAVERERANQPEEAEPDPS